MSAHLPEVPAAIPHESRGFHNNPDSQYLLPSDERERERLVLNHRVLQRACGNRLVFPRVEFQDDDGILDSGTGSAMWLLDVTTDPSIPPHVSLYGIDIETRLFPTTDPRVTARGNVHLRKCSMLDMPPGWTDKFALANQRLLGMALREDEWPRALSEIHRVLAPGRGWAQFGQFDNWEAGPATARFRVLMDKLLEAKGLVVDRVAFLPHRMQEVGFVDIHEEMLRISLGRWAGQGGTEARDVLIGAAHGIKIGVLKAGGFGLVQSQGELDAMIHDMGKEWDTTEGAILKYHVVWGRKAEA